jgi:hypothetical protein
LRPAGDPEAEPIGQMVLSGDADSLLVKKPFVIPAEFRLRPDIIRAAVALLTSLRLRFDAVPKPPEPKNEEDDGNPEGGHETGGR